MTESQYDMYNLIGDGTIVSQHFASTVQSTISAHFEMVKG